MFRSMFALLSLALVPSLAHAVPGEEHIWYCMTDDNNSDNLHRGFWVYYSQGCTLRPAIELKRDIYTCQAHNPGARSVVRQMNEADFLEAVERFARAQAAAFSTHLEWVMHTKGYAPSFYRLADAGKTGDIYNTFWSVQSHNRSAQVTMYSVCPEDLVWYVNHL